MWLLYLVSDKSLYNQVVKVLDLDPLNVYGDQDINIYTFSIVWQTPHLHSVLRNPILLAAQFYYSDTDTPKADNELFQFLIP